MIYTCINRRKQCEKKYTILLFAEVDCWCGLGMMPPMALTSIGNTCEIWILIYCFRVKILVKNKMPCRNFATLWCKSCIRASLFI
jgi:hypothetical protein